MGVVSAETKDEVIDSGVCSSEASSGTTTVKAGTDSLVVTYDGATDCDEESTVQWSLNGTAKGELVGVSCSSTGGMLSGWVAAALALVAFRRRRA